MFFTLAFVTLLVADAYADCFKPTGALSPDNPKPTFGVGQMIDIQWDGDTFFCPKVTPNTKVVIEMFESDYFGDDLVATIAQEATEADGYKWAVPFDLTAILTAGGESESGSDFYFKISEIANKGNTGKSVLFKLSSAGAFISVDGPRSRSFATGSVVDFDVLSSKLPSRTISCNLKRPPISWPLPNRDYGNIVKYTTTAALGVQKKAVKFALSSSLDTADNYFVECTTSDTVKPTITHTLPQENWFRIEMVKLVVTVTAPVANANPKANTLLRVSWRTDGAGLQTGDKFLVRLFRVNSQVSVTGFTPRADTEIWSSATANVAEPLVTSLQFDVPLPVEAGPVSWLTTYVLGGATNDFYVRLTLKSNTDFNVETPRFQIATADKGCGIEHPSSSEFIEFGKDSTFEFNCKGYSASSNTGRFALLRADGSTMPKLTTLDNAPRALTSGKITFRVPDTFVQGWVYRVQVTDDGANPQNSHIFLGKRVGNQCTVSGKTATCAGTPVLAATYENEYQLNTLTLTWAGPDCNSPSASISLTAVWQKGATGTLTTTTTTSRLLDNGMTQQKLLGSACADCLDIAFKFVEYPNDRKSLSFDVELSLPSHNTAALALGTVKFTDGTGAVQAAGVTAPCAVNSGTVMTTQPPPIIITQASGAVPDTIPVVGGPVATIGVVTDASVVTGGSVGRVFASVGAVFAAVIVLML